MKKVRNLIKLNFSLKICKMKDNNLQHKKKFKIYKISLDRSQQNQKILSKKCIWKNKLREILNIIQKIKIILKLKLHV